MYSFPFALFHDPRGGCQNLLQYRSRYLSMLCHLVVHLAKCDDIIVVEPFAIILCDRDDVMAFEVLIVQMGQCVIQTRHAYSAKVSISLLAFLCFPLPCYCVSKLIRCPILGLYPLGSILAAMTPLNDPTVFASN